MNPWKFAEFNRYFAYKLVTLEMGFKLQTYFISFVYPNDISMHVW